MGSPAQPSSILCPFKHPGQMTDLHIYQSSNIGAESQDPLLPAVEGSICSFPQGNPGGNAQDAPVTILALLLLRALEGTRGHFRMGAVMHIVTALLRPLRDLNTVKLTLSTSG